jgi:thiamine biosynthesis protein ThiS
LSDTIRVTVNGEAREIAAGTTVGGLIALLGAKGRVAVELNRDVVERRRHEEVVLAAGDQVEIVAFVGGG